MFKKETQEGMGNGNRTETACEVGGKPGEDVPSSQRNVLELQWCWPLLRDQTG